MLRTHTAARVHIRLHLFAVASPRRQELDERRLARQRRVPVVLGELEGSSAPWAVARSRSGVASRSIVVLKATSAKLEDLEERYAGLCHPNLEVSRVASAVSVKTPSGRSRC